MTTVEKARDYLKDLGARLTTSAAVKGTVNVREPDGYRWFFLDDGELVVLATKRGMETSAVAATEGGEG